MKLHEWLILAALVINASAQAVEESPAKTVEARGATVLQNDEGGYRLHAEVLGQDWGLVNVDGHHLGLSLQFM